MTAVRRGWLIAGLAAALLALAGSTVAVAAAMGRTPAVSGGTAVAPGPGMMGMAGPRQPGGRYGSAGDGRPVTTLGEAKQRAQAFADALGGGLRAGEVMRFANGYYSELLTAAGAGATEVLIDPAAGAVSVEFGPAMMWNTRYGMAAAGDVAARVSAGQAVRDAQAWLDARHAGLTAADPTAFPGYYTLHTERDGAVVGMMSVNAVTGALWYHTWHGAFVAMAGE